ncbi:hypothetical protein DRH29_01660 [candidate division Kazan bacterium]|uniref:Uncharacterized protein n=1 Tax=candidate division Kazan bacterium TaxID=2202143 RepID=A0A420ZDG9_UNCK3|nr:MAG: hypothetical protein DRH29_01660 [candidate division Kazan bacterium]
MLETLGIPWYYKCRITLIVKIQWVQTISRKDPAIFLLFSKKMETLSERKGGKSSETTRQASH